MEQNANVGSGQPGSPIISGPSVNSFLPGGQPQQQVEMVPKAQYDALEQKLGQQGEEVGQYRTFYNDIAPLLDKLNTSPEIVEAILSGKIDPTLVKAVQEGRVSIADAAAASQAQAQIQQLVKGTTPTAEDISRLVGEQTAEIRKDLEAQIKASEEARDFQAHVDDFISRTPDFAEYAQAINDWIDKHDVADIDVAYYAVKGEMSVKDAKQQAEKDHAENAKNFALNAGGGNPQATFIRDGNLVDQLIAPRSNPNNFG